MDTGHSDTTTLGIRIRVAAQFSPELSDPERGQYVYRYRVIITNEGDHPAKLLSRHWVIRDADNDKRETSGPGVAGERPTIPAGGRHEYTSRCPLPTEWGTMEGSYRMEREDGEQFDAKVGRFFLAPNLDPIETVLPAE